jgi:large subunit ribosomal protein L7/L12
MIMDNLKPEDVVNALGNLTVMELIKLTKDLETQWEVEAKPQTVVYQGPDLNQEKKEAQTEFSVVLVAVPAASKISCVKLVKEVLSLGLLEAKNLVEAAPKVVREGVSKEEATELVAKFVAAGATAELK